MICELILAILFLSNPLWARTAQQTVVSPHSGSAREQFVGTWELVSTEYRYKDGSRRPYPDAGPHGKGYLMYMTDGHMCAQLMNPDRPAWKDVDHPTNAEKISAFDNFSAYCGRFEVDEAAHTMVHLPEVASSPAFVGSRQPRPYSFAGDLLVFSDRETEEPGAETYTITWKKTKQSKDN